MISFDEVIREYLVLDPESPTGLAWRKRACFKRPVGSPALIIVARDGYYRGFLKDKRLAAHRVVFFLNYGYWPEQVDHIDGNRLNNSLSNLRAVTAQQNRFNQRKAKGYSYRADRDRYIAYIRVDGKTKNLGSYHTEQQARRAYLEAKKVMHPGTPDDYFEELK